LTVSKLQILFYLVQDLVLFDPNAQAVENETKDVRKMDSKTYFRDLMLLDVSQPTIEFRKFETKHYIFAIGIPRGDYSYVEFCILGMVLMFNFLVFVDGSVLSDRGATSLFTSHVALPIIKVDFS